ncbi:MAG TPA: hypothetical protein VKM72_04475 [Thermoanaerobaculia bacterium]|nr:hypothetical protein [Thermoanaerobaculia bacterium]
MDGGLHGQHRGNPRLRQDRGETAPDTRSAATAAFTGVEHHEADTGGTQEGREQLGGEAERAAALVFQDEEALGPVLLGKAPVSREVEGAGALDGGPDRLCRQALHEGDLETVEPLQSLGDGHTLGVEIQGRGILRRGEADHQPEARRCGKR